jgi:hypothetical protein
MKPGRPGPVRRAGETFDVVLEHRVEGRAVPPPGVMTEE